MDKDIQKTYQQQLDEGVRCRDWLALETTVEFLQPLRDKIQKLKDISYEDILLFDDKSFRSKVESAFLAAKEIEDYFALLDTKIAQIGESVDALKGKEEDY